MFQFVGLPVGVGIDDGSETELQLKCCALTEEHAFMSAPLVCIVFSTQIQFLLSLFTTLCHLV